MPQTKSIDELRSRLVEIAHLNSAVAVLGWDQEVHMPKKGSDKRAETLAHLSGIIHHKFVSLDSDGLLSDFKKQLDSNELNEEDRVVVAETWRSFQRMKKLPESFVRELSEIASKAQTVWAEARQKSDFSLFEPWLEKIIDLKKREAKYVGYKHSPYDALIDAYEPGMTAKEAERILTDLKNSLVPLLEKIKKSKVKIKPEKLKGNFPISKQFEFNKYIAEKMGYDLDAGRLDISTHPFNTSFNPHDVRSTTRYDEKNVLYALGSTIHETGHALYEQGMSAEHFGTPLSESVSLGIHESQSRMWENMIGKSREFWQYFLPKLSKEFPKPFAKISPDEFYAIINRVNPSFIRTEADEVTYNLHIIVRFEIERDLVEGKLAVKDVPKVWNKKMKDYFGLAVPNDTKGCLQDVHWSMGGLGYFPTYSFGNLYAAQFFHQLEKEMPDVRKRIAKGDLLPIRHWLKDKIHIHGKKYTAGALVQEVTGEALNSKYFSNYLEKKYTEIYELKKD
ncbi:carboxypeptidase M32 [Candidatus Parcubacteria bacterium]|nr:carboxypeptidase M32 [Candidatus Parcubacteria bacterium]